MAAPALLASLGPKLAKAWPTVQKAARWTVPGFAGSAERGGDLAGALAMNLGMNGVFAGMSAAALPENASLVDRGLAFGENFLGSSLVELGAQGLASGGIRMAGNRMGPMAQNMLRGGVAMGVPTVAWGSGLMPQPTAQRVWSGYNEQMEAQMQQQMQAEQMEIARAAREQAFAEMAGFGPMRQAYQGMYPGGYG
jgi:hypothetical protein